MYRGYPYPNIHESPYPIQLGPRTKRTVNFVAMDEEEEGERRGEMGKKKRKRRGRKEKGKLSTPTQVPGSADPNIIDKLAVPGNHMANNAAPSRNCKSRKYIGDLRKSAEGLSFFDR